jgi:hypothetical protein
MTLLARAAAALREAGVAHALIGAGALTAHGVNRATHDLDLLVLDPSFSAPASGAIWRAGTFPSRNRQKYVVLRGRLQQRSGYQCLTVFRFAIIGRLGMFPSKL